MQKHFSASHVAVTLLAALMLLAGPATARQVDVEFERLRLGEFFNLPTGTFVIRDSTTWEEDIVSKWPVIYRYVDGEYVTVPTPRYDFSKFTVLIVSYGMTACYETGGYIERITREEGEARAYLGHVYYLTPACLAEIPRADFVRISKDDVPDDVEITFVPREPGYGFEPTGWYPLAEGNAWSYKAYAQGVYTTYVEVIDETKTVDGLEWFRTQVISCDGPECQPVAPRWFAWTQDNYLLAADAAFAHVDTLYPTSPRSIFTVDVAKDCSLDSPYLTEERSHCPGQAAVLIYLWQGEPDNRRPYLHADLGLQNGSRVSADFLYGLGPMHHLSLGRPWLSGAIIEGEHIGDTDPIRRALSSESEPVAASPSGIEIFPHPIHSDAAIVVSGSSTGTAEVRIFDLLGRRVASTQVLVQEGRKQELRWREMIDAAPGTYFIQVTGPGESHTGRVVVVAGR